jgi:hypothetical protein
MDKKANRKTHGYQAGDYTKRHLVQVEEVCQLRRLNDMPCCWCQFDTSKACPKMREKKSRLFD